MLLCYIYLTQLLLMPLQMPGLVVDVQQAASPEGGPVPFRSGLLVSTPKGIPF